MGFGFGGSKHALCKFWSLSASVSNALRASLPSCSSSVENVSGYKLVQFLTVDFVHVRYDHPDFSSFFNGDHIFNRVGNIMLYLVYYSRDVEFRKNDLVILLLNAIYFGDGELPSA